MSFTGMARILGHPVFKLGITTATGNRYFNITQGTEHQENTKIASSIDKHYLCVMASDSPDQNLTQYFSLCNDFIHAARLREGNVLIHCLAGMSRSVTVAVAYIMSVTNLNWKEALKVVRAGRAVANPNLGFQKQLQDFEATRVAKVTTATLETADLVENVCINMTDYLLLIKFPTELTPAVLRTIDHKY
ncbi:hypothetical protein Zmor_007311 [Zophobas morio]|uniref:Dual specificity protein phosphatase 22 n=1 Tax=Zophobas morio TaxID=2755281 RepID=A0AA38J1N5_9CUCU|nr:hypothetical protein Zmor_007311 [Zophobas morio]